MKTLIIGATVFAFACGPSAIGKERVIRINKAAGNVPKSSSQRMLTINQEAVLRGYSPYPAGADDRAYDQLLRQATYEVYTAAEIDTQIKDIDQRGKNLRDEVTSNANTLKTDILSAINRLSATQLPSAEMNALVAAVKREAKEQLKSELKEELRNEIKTELLSDQQFLDAVAAKIRQVR